MAILLISPYWVLGWQAKVTSDWLAGIYWKKDHLHLTGFAQSLIKSKDFTVQDGNMKSNQATPILFFFFFLLYLCFW
jgi:hypothetical protein